MEKATRSRKGGPDQVECAVAGSPVEYYSPSHLGRLPLRALIAFSARCARRVQPLWGALSPPEREQLERALEIAEQVALGVQSTGDARRAEGVDVARWSAARPDFAAWRCARGAAIYALACACSEQPREAAVVALLVVREVHFAAAGDARSLAQAEGRFEAAWTEASGADARRVAEGVRSDLEQLVEQSARFGWTDETPVSPAFFGPLWRSEEPSWVD